MSFIHAHAHVDVRTAGAAELGKEVRAISVIHALSDTLLLEFITRNLATLFFPQINLLDIFYA